jgi:hypothetical protein
MFQGQFYRVDLLTGEATREGWHVIPDPGFSSPTTSP